MKREKLPERVGNRANAFYLATKCNGGLYTGRRNVNHPHDTEF